MSRIVLLSNPAAAGGRDQSRTLQQVADALRCRGHDVALLETLGRGTAASQVAALQTDILFACGGDGTAHDAAQGLAFRHDIALGVLPMGSANALARHLRLPLDPVAAALRQISIPPRTIPLGRVRYDTAHGERERFFLVTAGAGVDGELARRMSASSKRKLGRLAYSLGAFRLALLPGLPQFDFACAPAQPKAPRYAISAMAARVSDLGGAFRPMLRGTHLADPQLRVAAVHRPAWLSLPLWFTTSWFGLHAINRFAWRGPVESFTCTHADGPPVPVQADGDFFGTTPMTVSIVPDVLRILAPPEA